MTEGNRTARASDIAARYERVLAHGTSEDAAVNIVADELNLSASTVKRNLRRAEVTRDATDEYITAREKDEQFVKRKVEQFGPELTVQPVKTPTPNIMGPSERSYSVVVLGDAHDDPRLPKGRFAKMGRFVAEECKPDALIQIGDFATLDSMCKYEPQSFGEMRGRSMMISDDLDSFNEALEALNCGLRDFEPTIQHVTFGNHEARLFSASLRAFAQKAGFGDIAYKAYVDLLERYGWTYSEYGDIYFLGGVGFTHVPFTKMGSPYGGKTAERRVASDSRHDIVMGHSHEHKIESVPKIGGDYVKVVNAGCCLPEGHVEDYARHSNHGWNYGVLYLEITGGHIKGHAWTPMEELEANYDV